MRTTDKQLEGLICLVVLTFISYIAFNLFSSYQYQDNSIHHGDKNSGSAIIEITGHSRFSGIYFVPEKAKISEVLNIAGIENIGMLDEKIINTIISMGNILEFKSDGQLNVSKMSKAKRLALDMPVNINEATSMDLILISGIGRKTAEHIIHFRRTNGNFQRLEDLMKIPGIKEKKFAKLRRFFCIDC